MFTISVSSECGIIPDPHIKKLNVGSIQLSECGAAWVINPTNRSTWPAMKLGC